jgi:hypothetical protein
LDKNKVLIRLSEGAQTEFGRVAFANQSEPQRVFSSVWALESQVNNGGFEQYLRYTDSDVIAHAPVALEALGALACRTIVEQALGVLAPLPPTRDQREDALDLLDDTQLADLERLSTAFFEYPDDLTELLFEFVADRPETFGQLP